MITMYMHGRPILWTISGLRCQAVYCYVKVNECLVVFADISDHLGNTCDK